VAAHVLGLAAEALENAALLMVLYVAGLFFFNPGCLGDSSCREWSLRYGARRSLAGLGLALLLWLAGRLVVAGGGLGTVGLSLVYATVLLTLFAFYDSVAMYLINGLTSLGIRREAGPGVRARLVVEAGTPFYWLTLALGLFLVVLGDVVVQPSSPVPVVAGGVVAALILYVIGRSAWDRWVWAYRYLEAAGERSPLVETLRNLMGMTRLKPLIALAVAGAALVLGGQRAGYAFYLGAFLYTVPVYRVVKLYVRYAFAEADLAGDGRSEVIGPEAVEAARSLYYSTILSVASATVLFAAVPVAIASYRAWPLGAATALAYAGALALLKNVTIQVRGLNVLAPLTVELSKVLAARIRALVQEFCGSNGHREGCCALARAGCTAGGGLARRLVEEACGR